MALPVLILFSNLNKNRFISPKYNVFLHHIMEMDANENNLEDCFLREKMEQKHHHNKCVYYKNHSTGTQKIVLKEKKAYIPNLILANVKKLMPIRVSITFKARIVIFFCAKLSWTINRVT